MRFLRRSPNTTPVVPPTPEVATPPDTEAALAARALREQALRQEQERAGIARRVLREAQQAQIDFVLRAGQSGLSHDNHKPGGPLADAFADAVREGLVPSALYNGSRGLADSVKFLDPEAVQGDDFGIEYYPDDDAEPVAIYFRGNTARWNDGQFEAPAHPKPDHSTAEEVQFQVSFFEQNGGPYVAHVTKDLLARIEASVPPVPEA